MFSMIKIIGKNFYFNIFKGILLERIIKITIWPTLDPSKNSTLLMTSPTHPSTKCPSLRPAALLTVPVFCCRHEHYRQTNGWGEDPVADIDDFGVAGSPEVQGFDRMADCDVAIDAHGTEGEYAGEHIIVIYGDHYLAEDGPKWPCAH